MLPKLLRYVNKGRNLQSTLDHQAFKEIPFQYSWNNLVKAYDLRTWYVNNAVDDSQRLAYTLELESLHNELNYLSMRSFEFFSYFFFVIFFVIFF